MCSVLNKASENRNLLRRLIDLIILMWQTADYLYIFSLLAFLSTYHRKRRGATQAHLRVAGHLSIALGWGNPVKCLSQRHNKPVAYARGGGFRGQNPLFVVQKCSENLSFLKWYAFCSPFLPPSKNFQRFVCSIQLSYLISRYFDCDETVAVD